MRSYIYMSNIKAQIMSLKARSVEELTLKKMAKSKLSTAKKKEELLGDSSSWKLGVSSRSVEAVI